MFVSSTRQSSSHKHWTIFSLISPRFYLLSQSGYRLNSCPVTDRWTYSQWISVTTTFSHIQSFLQLLVCSFSLWTHLLGFLLLKTIFTSALSVFSSCQSIAISICFMIVGIFLFKAVGIMSVRTARILCFRTVDCCTLSNNGTFKTRTTVTTYLVVRSTLRRDLFLWKNAAISTWKMKYWNRPGSGCFVRNYALLLQGPGFGFSSLFFQWVPGMGLTHWSWSSWAWGIFMSQRLCQASTRSL